MMTRIGAALAAAALFTALALGGCETRLQAAGGVDGARIAAANADGEWLSYGKGYAEQRFSPLKAIDTRTVPGLGLAWFAEFDTDRGQEATPLVVDGTLYTTTAWSKVFAFDAATGKALWSYDPKVEGAKGFDACCDVVNRGVAAWGGRVFVGALDGRLIALDAKTGRPAWSVQTTDPDKPYTITGAPRVIKGKVLIGNGGAEYGVRGYITAYDVDTGRQAWRFYTAPNAKGQPDGAASDEVMAGKAAATWSEGDWKLTGGGATVWDAMAYDPQLDIAYFGVGNGTPWNHRRRSGGKGDNLFVSSVLALKPNTGKYVWHYQTTPGESWDYTATQHIILADLPRAGGGVDKVLMQAPKNGFFYVLDRASGKLISAKTFTPITWATGVDMATGRPVETPNARFQSGAQLAHPAPFGAHNWQPMAFSPKTNLVYLPAQTVPYAYQDASAPIRPGAWNTGVDADVNAAHLPPDQLKAVMAQVKGMLIAWDPATQTARWTVKHPYFWNGGVLATGGGLVFQGSAEGELAAYDAANGAKLWSYATGNGVIAAPMTYAIDGVQYLAVMVGVGGAGQISYPAMMPQRPRLPGRLLVFRLGATAQAPAFRPAPPSTFDITKASAPGNAARGYGLYDGNCQVCHGPQVSGAWLPDLKHSAVMTDADALKSVVIEGALQHNGMASFKRFLTPADVEDIRAYVISEAKGAAPKPALPGT